MKRLNYFQPLLFFKENYKAGSNLTNPVFEVIFKSTNRNQPTQPIYENYFLSEF